VGLDTDDNGNEDEDEEGDMEEANKLLRFCFQHVGQYQESSFKFSILTGGYRHLGWYTFGQPSQQSKLPDKPQFSHSLLLPSSGISSSSSSSSSSSCLDLALFPPDFSLTLLLLLESFLSLLAADLDLPSFSLSFSLFEVLSEMPFLPLPPPLEMSFSLLILPLVFLLVFGVLCEEEEEEPDDDDDDDDDDFVLDLV
jgi:hypothetical protein